jgi:pyrroloquinoline quinone biosynthesis protein B
MKLRIPNHCGPSGAAAQAPQLSPDGVAWCLLGAGGVVATSPHAVVLTGAHKNQVGGLLDLRGGEPINLYATPSVFEHLTQTLPLLPVLEQYCGVHWHLIAVAGDRRHAAFAIPTWPTLQFTAMNVGADPSGEHIALAVHDTVTDGRLFVVPASNLGHTEIDWLRQADCVLLSGPLPDRACAPRWLDLIAELPSRRKILLHATADDASDEALAARGIERACGGMEVEV